MAANYEPPLIRAVLARNIVECRRLIDAGEANVNEDRDGDRWTALHWASSGGHLDIAELLVSSGADMTIADYYGRTALHLATSYGHLDIVRLLLTEGADITIAANDGMTALHRASLYGLLDVANCLRKWPCSMAIIALQEIDTYKYLDFSSIEDLWHYLGNQ